MLTLTLLAVATAGTPAECIAAQPESPDLAWEVVASDPDDGTVYDFGIYTTLLEAREAYLDWPGAVFYVDMTPEAEAHTRAVLACAAPDWPVWGQTVSGLLDVCRDVGGCL